jgi:hypothetical protein
MSSPGRPKSEYRSAEHEGAPVSVPELGISGLFQLFMLPSPC